MYAQNPFDMEWQKLKQTKNFRLTGGCKDLKGTVVRIPKALCSLFDTLIPACSNSCWIESDITLVTDVISSLCNSGSLH